MMSASKIICDTGFFDLVYHKKHESVAIGSRCRLCSASITEGTASKHMSKSISNSTQVKSPHESHVCVYCMTLLKGSNISKVQGYTSDKSITPNLFGMLYIGGEEPHAVRVTHGMAETFITNPPVPPKTPFVFLRRVHHTLSNGTSRHTAWMARVNLNTSKYFLQVNYESLLVDTKHIPAVMDILGTMEKQSYPIYGADWVVHTLCHGDYSQLPMLEDLSHFGHDSIIVAAHLLESAKTFEKFTSKKTGASK